MKRFILALGVVVLVVITGVAVALALHRLGWCHQRGHNRGPFGYMTRELNLSAVQQSKIHSLWQSERPAVYTLVEEAVSEDNEMNAAVRGDSDESKVQEIAAREGATIAKLLVEKERLQSRIYATVLNPAQRGKADQLQTRWQSRLNRLAARIGNVPPVR